MPDTDQPQDQAQQPLVLPPPAPEEAFLVVSLQGLPNWPTAYGGHLLVPEARRPTVLHTSQRSAEGEALRLARAHGGQFAVFKAMLVTQWVETPTHVTLAGKVMCVDRRMVLVHLDDGIPF